MPGLKSSNARFDGVERRAALLLSAIDNYIAVDGLLPAFSDVRELFPEQDEASCRSYVMVLADRGSIDVELSCRPPVILRRVMA